MESLRRGMTKKITAVLCTTHNAPSAPPGPLQEESTLQYTENAETFIKHYMEAIVNARSAASAKPNNSCYR